jgi:hypothetical protein
MFEQGPGILPLKGWMSGAVRGASMNASVIVLLVVALSGALLAVVNRVRSPR